MRRLMLIIPFMIGCTISDTTSTITNEGVMDAGNTQDASSDTNITDVNTVDDSPSDPISDSGSNLDASHHIIDRDAEGSKPEFEMCPSSCTSAINQWSNCYSKEVECIVSYNHHPEWQQLCIYDHKYCNSYYWGLWCLTQRESCNATCAQVCQSCSDDNGCNLPNYDCTEACQSDYLGN